LTQTGSGINIANFIVYVECDIDVLILQFS